MRYSSFVFYYELHESTHGCAFNYFVFPAEAVLYIRKTLFR